MLRAALLLGAALSAGLLSWPADARSRALYSSDAQESRDDRDYDREERQRREGAADAARRAQMRNGGGRVLSVEPLGDNYRVKVLKDGVVRVYVIEGG